MITGLQWHLFTLDDDDVVVVIGGGVGGGILRPLWATSSTIKCINSLAWLRSEQENMIEDN